MRFFVLGNDQKPQVVEAAAWLKPILAGLLPILFGHGAGSEVMSRIAAPMIGGMVTAPLLTMLVVPAAFLLMRRRRARPTPASQSQRR